MATLVSDQVTLLWRNGDCEHFALYAVKNVTTGDTADIGNDFRAIMQTAWMGATVSGVVAGSATGTVVTAPSGLTSAGAYLLVQGVAK